MPSLAALMVNYNGGDVLLESLASLPAAGVALKDTVLVDNASTDGSHRAANVRFQDLTSVETDKEMSFAGANNLGLRRLAGAGAPEFVLFVNNDAALRPGCAATLREVLDRDRSLGAAAPLILDAGGKVWYAGGDIDWREAGGRLFGQGREDGPEYRRPALVAFATLCVLLVRWEALEKVGLLDESYFFYDEDLDLCLRLANAGYGIAYEPAATAVHRSGYSTAPRGPEFIYRHMARNRLLTMRRHGTPVRWLGFAPRFAAMMAWKAARFLFSARPQAARAIAAGLKEGLTDPLLPIPSLAGGGARG